MFQKNRKISAAPGRRDCIDLSPDSCMFAGTNLRRSRHILSRWGKNVSWTSRKATRGRVLWTPLEGGESRGGTGVAAKAVRRGLEPRIPLTLKRTSDRDFSPPLPAARGLRSRQHCGRRGDSPWTLYQTRTEFDIRAYDLTRCTTLSAFGAFSFFHRARRCLSFRQDEKKDRGAHCAGHIL